MKSGATETSYTYLQKHYQFPKNVFVSHLPNEIKKSNHNYKILWAHHAYDQPLFLDFDHYIVDHIVSPSEWNKEQFIKYHNVPKDKITVIPNGVSDIFSYSDKKSKTMIYTSVPYKGLEVLAEIIPLIQEKQPDVKFKIFSSMSLYGLSDELYEDLYEKLNSLSNVEYSSAVEQEELVKHYQESAFFVHPNVWEETFCVSMAEAMKCGCYPIITDIGALKEVAGEKNCLIVPIEGTSTTTGFKVTREFINNFADACCVLLDNFESNRQNYNCASKLVSNYVSSNYNWKSISKHWSTLINQIAKQTMDSEKNSLTRYKLINAEEAVYEDKYLYEASKNVLRWEESDKELAQGRTNFQIEKFIALEGLNISVTFEHILKERRIMAEAYMRKIMEMKLKVREFEFKWKDKDKTKPLIFGSSDENAPKVACWYDLEELGMMHYLKSSELEIRDRLHQLEHLDKLLEKMVELNGGKPVTREQFLEENENYWETRLAQQALDELLSRQMGISTGNITAMRQASAPSIVDERNELKRGYFPVSDFSDTKQMEAFVGNLQSKVIEGYSKLTGNNFNGEKNNNSKEIGENKKNYFNEGSEIEDKRNGENLPKYFNKNYYVE